MKEQLLEKKNMMGTREETSDQTMTSGYNDRCN